MLNISARSSKLQSQQQIAAIIVEPEFKGRRVTSFRQPSFYRPFSRSRRSLARSSFPDEMQTAFGRAGAMWGFEHDQLAPDILTVGKGHRRRLPVERVISTDEHCQAQPYSLPSGSSSSYGGNPLAAAAGLATLEVILDEQLAENSRRSVRFSSRDFRHSSSASNSWVMREAAGLMLGSRAGEEQENQRARGQGSLRVGYSRAVWIADHCP